VPTNPPPFFLNVLAKYWNDWCGTGLKNEFSRGGLQ
jgi:hypothetical protein